jgi:DNA helicase-2/ATP-dependent DNA helicase PcrA
MAVSRKVPAFHPDPRQQQAIEHVTGPLLVLAGAGTGKTTVLTRRVANLIAQGHARPDEILALTYTLNAADEMLQRLRRDLGSSRAEGLEVGTFHGYCNKLLLRAGRNFQVLDEKQLWIFVRRHLAELKLDYFVRAANVSKFLDDLLDFIRRCQDELVSPEQYADYVRRVERGDLPRPRVARSKDANELTAEESVARCGEIASVYASVEKMLRERNLGTFGHMIVQANDLLARDSTLLNGERSRTRFILVDEFQDANFAQIEVLHKLAGAEDGRRNIFAVGDPDQGIYRFRGASSGAFDLFLRRFPEARIVALTENRRSTTPILRVAHALISKNPEPFTNATSAYHRAPLTSARDAGEALDAVQRAPVEAVLVSGSLMEATDLVAALIERRRRSRCLWKHIAVLYRSHFHREEVAAELARGQVPFSIEGLDVMDTREVRDLLACAGAVVSPDSASLLRVAALEQFAIDPEALRNAIQTIPRNTNASIATILPQVPGGPKLLAHVETMRHEIADKNTHAALLSLTTGFQQSLNPAVRALLNFSLAWEKSPLTETGTLAEFLECLDYFREARGTIPLAASDADDTVKLMTVHGAKGLEFDHVFVLRAVSPSFPASYREPLIDFPPELRASRGPTACDDRALSEQEERRLFYVAMTRARDTLTLYGPFGKGKEITPPGYLRELLKNRDLRPWLRRRSCREFQTEIFTALSPPASRLAEWVALPPASALASTLSASAIDNYKLCPLRFKLDREWRIPGEVSAALQYGASVHRVLRTYYDSVRWGRTKSDDDLIQQFREDLATEAIADRYQHELYEKQGSAQLRQFLAAARGNPPCVLHTEEQFSIKLGETTLVGRIDRIDRGEGNHVVIVDYKTGKPKSQEDADQSLQLSLYALAAREKWGYAPARLIFHNLEGNILITTERSGVELERAKLEVEEIAGKIAAGRFDATPGFHCSSCAYRVLCPRTEKRIPEPMLAIPAQAGP